MANIWVEESKRAIQGILRDFKDEVISLDKTPLSDSKRVAYNRCKREISEIILQMAQHLDYVNDFLKKTQSVLLDCAAGETPKPEVSARLIRELENYLATPMGALDPDDNWPDSPSTALGVCWMCGNEGNIRWLADPLKKEPRDPDPWCQRCYKLQKKKGPPR